MSFSTGAWRYAVHKNHTHTHAHWRLFFFVLYDRLFAKKYYSSWKRFAFVEPNVFRFQYGKYVLVGAGLVLIARTTFMVRTSEKLFRTYIFASTLFLLLFFAHIGCRIGHLLACHCHATALLLQFNKFRHVSDIPVKFIDNHVKLRGRVSQVSVLDHTEEGEIFRPASPAGKNRASKQKPFVLRRFDLTES